MFLERLDSLCKQRNTTIYSVVNAVGGNTGSIDGWKKKGSIPRPELLSRMASYLCTSTDYLLERTNNPYPIEDGMFKLDRDEAKLIECLRSADEPTRQIVYNMTSAALAPTKVGLETTTPALVFSLPKDGNYHHARRESKPRATRKPLKRVEGSAAAGAPITAVPEDDTMITVPSKYLSDDYFIVRARGDSMIDANIDDGDFCVFQRDAHRDAGRIMLAQIDGHTEQPEGTIKRVFFHGKKIELRPANRAYESMFFPTDEVTLIGVLVDILVPESNEA